MRVGIISERLNRPLTGVGTYTSQLIKWISMIYPKEKLFLIDYQNHEIFKDINKIFIAPWMENLPKKSYFWQLYSQYKLRNNNFDLDVIHSPENATLFVKLKKQSKIVTVHDIRQHIFPEFNKETILSYLFLQKTLKTADKIIAVSNNTKNDLINHFKINDNKINVVFEAADEKFRPLNNEETNKIKQKYNLDFKFILYLGNLAKHKNISTFLKAFYKIKKKNLPHKFVIAGIKRVKHREIFETIENLNLQKDVIFKNYIVNEDLTALYNAAELFVYPSLYEGFGLPPLEAMSCGTPILTSNTSSLPEVVGNGGIMIDPYNVNKWVNTLYMILTNDGLREELSKKGLKRAKLFCWKKTAEETINIYKETYNQK